MGILVLYAVSVFGQAQVGESFGVGLDPGQKSAQQFHGGFYHLLRSDALDARNFFAPRVDPYRFQDYRFALTGPVLVPRLLSRRKTWYFAWGIAWNSDTRPASGRGTVPTAAERAGDFQGSPLCTAAFRAQFSDCRVPADSWSRDGPALLAPYPLPNAQGPGFNFFRNAVRRNAGWQHTGRLDWAPRGRWKASARVSRDAGGQQLPFQSSPFGNAPLQRRRLNDSAGLRLTVNVNVQTVNSFSITASRNVQFDRMARLLVRRYAGYDGPELFAENPEGILPAVTIAGFTGYNPGRAPAYQANTLVARDDYARVAGKHEWKAAAQWTRSARRVEISSVPAGALSFSRGPNSTGNVLADVLLGRFSSYQEGRATPVPLVYDQLELSLADRWKLRPRFVLEYGVTYLWMPLERRLNGLLANFSPSRFDPAQARVVARDGTLVEGAGDPRNGILAGSSRRLVRASQRNLAPRAGLSWQPFQKKKLSVRAGAGIALDRARLDSALANNPPEETVTRLNGFLEDPASALKVASRPLSLLALHPDFRNPTVYSGNTRLEQEWRRHAWAAEYKFSIAKHLLRQRNVNQLPAGALLGVKGTPTDALRPYRGYGTIAWREAAGSSDFHAVEFSLSPRKPVAGVSYRLRYTFSKVLSDSFGESEFPQDNFNFRNERGAASFDRRHALILEYSYQPKFGAWMPSWAGRVLRDWEITGASTFSTGRPFDVVQPGDRAMMGGGVQRPDVIVSPELSRGDRSIARYFNVDAFRSPAAGTLGNAARFLVYGPGTNNANLALSRTVPLSKRCRGQFRAELSNAFNHPSFQAIGTVFDPATYLMPWSSFGRVVGAGPGRSIQLTFKLVF